jgi:hypothetical protein
MSNYMLMLRGNWREWDGLSAENMQKIMESYGDWVTSLKKEGRYKSGAALSEKSRLIKGDNVIDGPYAETKEAITGYFLIEADSHDQAVTIARGCPALRHGETVEVIELGS